MSTLRGLGKFPCSISLAIPSESTYSVGGHFHQRNPMSGFPLNTTAVERAGG